MSEKQSKSREIAMRRFSQQPYMLKWLFHPEKSGQVMTFKNQINIP
jgi:hypothetical protein